MHRFTEVDGLRGLAALMVAFLHFDVVYSLSENRFINSSWLFVDFFFVLSGFIIAANYSKRINDSFALFSFIALRVGRLWPLHVFILFLYVLVEFFIFILLRYEVVTLSYMPFQGARYAAGIIYEVLFLHALPFLPNTSWNSPSWSISVEFVTYIVFGVLILSLPRYRNWLCVIFIMGSSIVVSLSSEGIESAHEVAIFRCIYGFFVGVLLFSLYSSSGLKVSVSKLRNNTILFSVIEVLSVISVITFISYAHIHGVSILAPFLFALTTLPFLFGNGVLSRLLRTRLFLSLGNLSYSIYMVHSFIFSILNFSIQLFFSEYVTRSEDKYQFVAYDNANENMMAGNIVFVVTIMIVIFSSALLYRFVELPCRDITKKYIKSLRTK